MAVDRRKQPAY